MQWWACLIDHQASWSRREQLAVAASGASVGYHPAQLLLSSCPRRRVSTPGHVYRELAWISAFAEMTSWLDVPSRWRCWD